MNAAAIREVGAGLAGVTYAQCEAAARKAMAAPDAAAAREAAQGS
jgi:phosphotransferase system enzyme I (PtsI)